MAQRQSQSFAGNYSGSQGTNVAFNALHLCQYSGGQQRLKCWHCSQQNKLYRLGKILRFCPGALGNEESKEFLVYQFLRAILECLQNRTSFFKIRLEDIQVGEDKWLYIDEYKETDDIDLSQCMRQWCMGQMSNFDYLMVLNQLAGRCEGDPSFHPMLPWVIDMQVHPHLIRPEVHTDQEMLGFRDLTKTKYRLMKGDEQLDHTYESSSVPHHISDDDLSELTYCLYKARVLPKSTLISTIRSVFEPNEYPSSICRLYETTPDECIPEFYIDPTIFKSIHQDLPDLQIPSWANTPEEFIQIHRDVLESDYVSSNLHNWIDLTFGFKLKGKAALKEKNLHLPNPEPQRLTNKGVFQIFKHPHPPRSTNFASVPQSNGFQFSVIEDYMMYQQESPTSNLGLQSQSDEQQDNNHVVLFQQMVLIIIQIVSGDLLLDRREGSINRLRTKMPKNILALIHVLQNIGGEDIQSQIVQLLEGNEYFQNSTKQAYTVLCSVQHLHYCDSSNSDNQNSDIQNKITESISGKLFESLDGDKNDDDDDETDEQSTQLCEIFQKLFIAEGIRLELYEKFESLLRSNVSIARLCLPYLVCLVDSCLDSIFDFFETIQHNCERFGVDREVLFEEVTETLEDLMWQLMACFQPWQISKELVRVVRRGAVASLQGQFGESSAVLMNPKIHVVLLRTVGMATYIDDVLGPLLESMCVQPCSTSKSSQLGKQVIGCMVKELESAVVIQQIIRPLILRLGSSPQVAALLIELITVNPDGCQVAYIIHQLLVLISSWQLPANELNKNVVSDGLTVLEATLPVLSVQQIMQLVLAPLENVEESDDENYEKVPMCLLVKRLMNFQIMLAGGWLLNRVAALLSQACWIMESKTAGKISESVLCQLIPFFKIPSHNITSAQEELLYWDLVHILYTDLVVLVEPQIVRAKIQAWAVIERTLRGRFGWQPPPNKFQFHSQNITAKNVYAGITNVYSHVYQSLSIRVPSQSQVPKIYSAGKSTGGSSSYWRNDFQFAWRSNASGGCWQENANYECRVDWQDELSQSRRKNGFKQKWNLKAKVVHQWSVFSDELQALEVDENEAVILACGTSTNISSRQPLVKCWDVGGTQALGSYTGHVNSIKSCTFLDNFANRVASLDRNGAVHIWRANGACDKPIWVFLQQQDLTKQKQTSQYNSMLSRRGTNGSYDLVTGCTNGDLQGLDIEKGSVLRTWQALPKNLSSAQKISSICSISSSAYLSATNEGVLSVLDSRQDEINCFWKGHQDQITKVDCINNFIVSSSLDKTLRLWDARKMGHQGLVLTYSGFRDGIGGFSFHDGTAIAFCGSQIALLSLIQHEFLISDGQQNAAVSLRGLDGFKEGGTIVSLSTIAYSRLIAVGLEEGVIKLCC